MVPEAGRVLHGLVSVRGYFSYHLYEINYASLFKVIHAAADFEVDVAIRFSV